MHKLLKPCKHKQFNLPPQLPEQGALKGACQVWANATTEALQTPRHLSQRDQQPPRTI